MPTFCTELEYQARGANICPACQSRKEQGSLVCWDCFKGRKHPDLPALKYFEGDFVQWFELAQTVLR